MEADLTQNGGDIQRKRRRKDHVGFYLESAALQRSGGLIAAKQSTNQCQTGDVVPEAANN